MKGILRSLLVVASILAFPAFAEIYGGVEFPQGAISFADISPDMSLNAVVSGGYPIAPALVVANATGAPDFAQPGCNQDSPSCRFVSLGNGGSVTLVFEDNVLIGDATPAEDLWIFEIGEDVEDSFVEIGWDSEIDGSRQWLAVGKIFGATSGINIDPWLDNAGLPVGHQFKYVRITDDPNEGDPKSPWAGADIDAVGAISTLATNYDCNVKVDITIDNTPASGPSGPGSPTSTNCGGSDHYPTSLTFEYTGGGCPHCSNHQQRRGLAYCTGRLDEMGGDVLITAENGRHDCTISGTCDIYDVDPVTPPPLSQGMQFTVSVKPGVAEFSSKTKITLSNGNRSEVNVFNTSCSVALNVGDVFGSLTLVGIDGGTGTEPATPEHTDYTYTVTNYGDAISNVRVFDSVFGDLGTVADLGSGLVTPTTATLTIGQDATPVESVASVTADIEDNLGGIHMCTDAVAPIDADEDGVVDADDNCPSVPNADQADANSNGLGDACDIDSDSDLDGVLNSYDNCPTLYNPDQLDLNLDGVGDVCELPPLPAGCVYNPRASKDTLFILLLLCAGFYVRTRLLAAR